MKSENWLIIQIGLAIFILTLLSFWLLPVHLAGVSMGFALLGDAFKVLLGYKFGKSMPQQQGDAKEGQSSQTSSTTTVKTDAPLAAPVVQVAPAAEVQSTEKEK